MKSIATIQKFVWLYTKKYTFEKVKLKKKFKVFKFKIKPSANLVPKKKKIKNFNFIFFFNIFFFAPKISMFFSEKILNFVLIFSELLEKSRFLFIVKNILIIYFSYLFVMITQPIFLPKSISNMS